MTQGWGVGDRRSGIRTSPGGFSVPNPRSLALILWLIPGLLISLLCMRFLMRALGVREDIPFPGFVYDVTTPLVSPFYRYFPVSPRFDVNAVEIASLAAVATV